MKTWRSRQLPQHSSDIKIDLPLFHIILTRLLQVLLYHTVAGNVSSSQLTNDEVITTAAGLNATVRIIRDRNHEFVFINDALVIAPDNYATNGECTWEASHAPL